MYMNPFNLRWSFDLQTAEEVARTWWIPLFSGLISIGFGVVVLAVDWSVSSLAVFAGIMFVLAGIAALATRAADGSGRTGSIVPGVLEIAAGIAIIVWPDIGLLTLAIVIGLRILIGGLIMVVGALANRHVPHFWLILILGLVQVPIGIWLLRRPGMTLAILITLIGIWSIVTGIGQCVLAFELRKLPRRFREREVGLEPAAST
jgi:uncharacterized membrane protein HdeD (DUF308 family)